MMKRIFGAKSYVIAFCLPFLFGYSNLMAQKNDYNWLAGYDANAQPSTGGGTYFGNNIMNFNQSPVKISYDSLAMNFDKTNTSYSDSNGNLLFYTNGIYIANLYNEMIENSDSLNAGWLQYDWDPNMQYYGYRNSQGILSFQSLTNPNQYYLIQSFTDSVPGSDGTNIYCSNIYSTLLDMSENNGHGMVLYKNKSIIQDSLGNEFTAVRHGNGRDWWVLFQKRNTNCFYELLIDTSGLNIMPGLVCGGLGTPFNDIAATCFSPDGSKFVYLNVDSGLTIYDFDRCTGNLSTLLTIPMPTLDDSIWLGIGVAISPNNRFLYVTATEQIYQYDLTANDIAGSIDTVALYSNYNAPFGSYFYNPQIGPDGKIYISCGNADTVYHVINNPDAKGADCGFVQHGVHLPSVSVCVPNFPNYRLGALTQSQCDSLTGLNEVQREAKEQILKVFPNPANDMVTVDYGFTDWNKGPVSMEVANELGQVVYTQPLPMYSGYQRLDISRFVVGMYTVFIMRNEGVVASQKIVIIH